VRLQGLVENRHTIRNRGPDCTDEDIAGNVGESEFAEHDIEGDRASSR
jgi:hypothetical protein